ncbi:MAG TPA: AI-2E family transporter [Gammaproteobacteria bacterium]|nr:AI-2E family transporter [Gammaproteobacteria bacterium]
MTETNVERGFFVALLLVVTLAFFWLIRGFLQPIFWAVALGIVVFPLHARLQRRLHNRRGLAASISVVTVVIVVILPLIGLGAAVANEGAALYNRLQTGGHGIGDIFTRVEQRMPQVTALIERVGVDPTRLQEQAQSAAVAVSRAIAERALSIGSGTLRGTIFFFLMLYLLFFFLRDGPRILDALIRALPLGDQRERHLFGRFAEVSRATIKGTLVIGIVQGTIGGIAFAALGISAPVLWGTVMALLSILPAVGTALVWLPASIFLLLTGHIFGGIALIFVGLVPIGLVDNLLRPVLVGRDTQLPDYLILLSTLGGLAAFGLAGIVIGPTIAAFFLSVWQMAEQEFTPSPGQQAADPPPPQG